VAGALAAERERYGESSPRRPGERIFRRDVIIDGHEKDEGLLDVAVQLTDLHLAPAPGEARPMERFAAQLELRLLAETRAYDFKLARITGGERRRTFADLETATWQNRDSTLAQLVDMPLLSGFSAQLLQRFGDAPDDRPLLDALLMLAPALIQIIAALSEDWPAQAKQNPSMMGTGGLPDSCYMWRREGALSQHLKHEIKSGTLQPRAARDRSRG
jgi:hypothetical protein